MKKGKSLSVLIFAVFMVMAFVPVAWSERGVTDTEIRIGQWGPQTGPAALWGNVARGTGCYFEMINAEGGIHGRRLTYFLRDDGYMPPKTKAVVKELVEDKKVFGIACGLGTATGMAVKKYLHTKKVPWVGLQPAPPTGPIPPHDIFLVCIPSTVMRRPSSSTTQSRLWERDESVFFIRTTIMVR